MCPVEGVIVIQGVGREFSFRAEDGCGQKIDVDDNLLSDPIAFCDPNGRSAGLAYKGEWFSLKVNEKGEPGPVNSGSFREYAHESKGGGLRDVHVCLKLVY